MTRLRSLVVLVALAGTAVADGRRALVVAPPETFVRSQAAQVSPYLYLNRCTGGCTVTGGSTNDAKHQVTTIPAAGTYTIGEFATVDGQTGSAADADWAALVQCMKQVYSPYAITVTDQVPQGVSYTETIVAGQPTDLGQPGDVLGIAVFANNCAPQDNAIAFAFANHHPPGDHVLNVCWTAAQESAHIYGLDHEYEFTDGTSACNDPMTYRVDCGGEKFFRNRDAKCGEYAARPCRCSDTQNSHQKLLTVFGPGTPITTAPTVSIVSPTAGQMISDGSVVHPEAGAQRGIAKLELWLNGSKWSEIPGAAFQMNGQPDPYDYTINFPKGLPDSLYDVVVKAFDDLGTETDSAPVAVVEGAACTDASHCLQDQKCDAGHCHWDAPTGELGDSCSYPQFCKSWTCLDFGGGSECAQTCEQDDPTSCPSGFACEADGSTSICVATGGGGCCSVAGDEGWLPGLLAAGVLAIVLGRRRC